MIETTDIVVVGAGLAGLGAAAEIAAAAPEAGVVVADVGGGASSEIMGFSAPANEPDSPECLYADTLASAGGAGDPALMRVLANRALPELRRLEALGIAFDREADGRYAMARALGSRWPRVAHAGTSTGRMAMAKLACSVRAERVARVAMDGTAVAGVVWEDGRPTRCKAVVLACGGFAGLWGFSSWTKALNGDGPALALDAGARLRDLRFVQFEPTVTAFPPAWSGFPVITTLLGEGAMLRNRLGGPLLAAGEPLPRKRELAERIQREIDEGRALEHGGVMFDCSGVDAEALRRRYPGYYGKFRALGASPSAWRFEVRPGAHTTLGGVAVDARCAAVGVEGLFAAGETMGGVHGRDRIGGNAGLEVLVFGRIAGRSAADYAAAAALRPYPADMRPPAPMSPGTRKRIAAALDDGFGVRPARERMAAGRAAAAELPPHPTVRLVLALFDDALARGSTE